MDNFSNSENEEIQTGTTSDIRDGAEGISGRSRTKYISMVFDKKYINDDDNILGIANIGLQDIFMVSKYTNPDYIIEILLANGTKRVIIFNTEGQQNAFFDKIKAELI